LVQQPIPGFRSPEEELKLLAAFASETAEGHIAELKAVDNIGGSENPAN
jgi:hypothetical protein